MKYDIGHILEVLLEEKNMTLEEFAKKIGVDEKTATHYVKNGILPSEKILKKIAKLLKVSTNFLTSGVDDPDENDESSYDFAYAIIAKNHSRWSDYQKVKMIKKLF